LNPVRTAAQVDQVAESIDAAGSLSYVMDAIRITRKELEVPLIGFAGAPFTLASYAIEGGGSKNYYETKKMMYGDEGLWNALMTKFSSAIAGYLVAQIDAGAQAVQLFDSWVGCLSPSDYRRYVLPHTKAIFDALPKDTPAIHFGTGNPALYPLMKEAGGDVIGIDWRISIDDAWSALGDDVGLQGNMDPAALLASTEVLRARASKVLDSAAGRPGHIFNLGHGIMPQAQVDQARALVDHVHEASQR
jgi:uroporphyrinogen decarboxylase